MAPEDNDHRGDHCDAQGDGSFRMEAWARPAASGAGYLARVRVRRLPTLDLAFEDESAADADAWATPQQALTAALERGRQFVRLQALGKAMQEAGGLHTPDDV